MSSCTLLSFSECSCAQRTPTPALWYGRCFLSAILQQSLWKGENLVGCWVRVCPKSSKCPLCACEWVSRCSICNTQRSVFLHALGKNGYAMTHPNLQTNGASLEDCHTNFFALVCTFTVIRNWMYCCLCLLYCVNWGKVFAFDVFFMWTNAPATLPDVIA